LNIQLSTANIEWRYAFGGQIILLFELERARQHHFQSWKFNVQGSLFRVFA
jgi:hypothetical protein